MMESTQHQLDTINSVGGSEADEDKENILNTHTHRAKAPDQTLRKRRNSPKPTKPNRSPQPPLTPVRSRNKSPNRRGSPLRSYDRNDDTSPLTSTRDPRRKPLLSRMPFSPAGKDIATEGLHRHVRQIKSCVSPKRLAQARNENKKTGTFSEGNDKEGNDEKNSKKELPSFPLPPPNFKRQEVTPAYAYKNNETGLLEITTVKPPDPSRIATESSPVGKSHHNKSGDGDEEASETNGSNNSEVGVTTASASPALYPIAVNGGGVGLFRDPRQFGTNAAGLASASSNLRTGTSRRSPVRTHVSFSPLEVKESLNDIRNEIRDEATQMSVDWRQNEEIDLELGNGSEASSDVAYVGEQKPWRVWEKVHNEMVRLAEFRHNRRNQNTNNSNGGDLLDIETGQEKNKVARISSVYNEDDFDFVLVLKAQEVYAYWADLLDFRAETLGVDCDDDLERQLMLDHMILMGKSDENINEEVKEEETADDEAPKATKYNPIDAKPLPGMKTPDSEKGLRRRFVRDNTQPDGLRMTPSMSSRVGDIHPFEESSKNFSHLPLAAGSATVDKFGRRVFKNRKSLFERAMDSLSPTRMSTTTRTLSPSFRRLRRYSRTSNSTSHNDISPNSTITPPRRYQRKMSTPGTPSRPSSATIARRRWGAAYDAAKSSTPNLMSPPIRTLPRQKSMQRKRRTISSTSGGEKKKKKRRTMSNINNPNSLEMEDIPNQVIPRGIAARTNGMEEFLSALRRGIVVRRHRANAEPAFVKIFSKDGGDTIKYKYVHPEKAMIALKEQRVRYNKNHKIKKESDLTLKSASKRWSKGGVSISSGDQQNDSSVPLPDYIAAKQYRDEQNKKKGGIVHAVADLATKMVHSGTIKAADVVVVQPARHQDPYAAEGELGTSSLRESPAEYVTDNSFSIVLPAMRDLLPTQNMRRNATEKWHAGEGSESSFWSLDIELATPGEYWVVFRGFLLLHRDAAYGRFAAQRACGFGSHYNKRELEMIEQKREVHSTKNISFRPFLKRRSEAGPSSQDDQNKQSMNSVKNDESHNKFCEPPTRSTTAKIALYLFTKGRSILTGSDEEVYNGPVNAVPPPSDYFLGFKSSGTQIWSRLRQAGLETTRIYALDTRRVMIKVRCPPERLMDVAEVLRLKLKTRDGIYAPFRETMISQYLPTDDGAPVGPYSTTPASLFRSSERQAIIDFIIRSRIRDSGAELGQGTDLGKHIQIRAPLHMHARLESLYEGWVLYWKLKNWVGGHDGYDMTVGTNNGHEHSSLRSTNSSSSGIQLTGVGEDDDPGSTVISTSEQENVPSIFTRFIFGSFYQPLDSIEQYYGEKVAFYFAWLQHCCYHLTYISVVGLIVFLIQTISGKWDHPLRPFFSVVIMLWSFFVMTTWRQRSNFLAHRWGTLNYREEETTRPQFKGEYRRCEITQEWVVYYPAWKRWLKYCISLPLTAAFTFAVSILILQVHANRDILLARYFESNNDHGEATTGFDFSIGAIGKQGPINSFDLKKENVQDPKFWFLVVGLPILLGLCLPLLNFLLMRVSVMLNEFENYRTESAFRNHLIIKVFSFRFVCYFASLYYYAYFTNGTDEKSIENSMLRVGASLFIYLTISNWWMFLLTIYFPLLMHRWRIYRERLKLRDELRRLERMEKELKRKGIEGDNEGKDERKQLINKRLLLEQAQSSAWEEMMLRQHDSFPEYVLAVINFAYVTCFSVVLPITPLICLFNQLLTMRLDAYKICRGRRRPLAQKTGGIGVWENVLHIVTVVAVITNCSLMALTSSQFVWIGKQLGQVGLFALVVGWEHIMLFIKYLMQSSFPQYPLSLQDALKKERYQASRKMNSNMRAKKERRSRSARLSSLKSLDSTGKEVKEADMDTSHSQKEIRKKHAESFSPIAQKENGYLSTIPSMDDAEDSPLLKQVSQKGPRRACCSGKGSSDKRTMTNSTDKLGYDNEKKKNKFHSQNEERLDRVWERSTSDVLTPKRQNTESSIEEFLDDDCLPTPRQISLEEDSISSSRRDTNITLNESSHVESPFGMYFPTKTSGTQKNSSMSNLCRDDCTPNKLLACKSIDDDETLFSNDGDTPMTTTLSPYSKLLRSETELLENAFAEDRIRQRLSSLEEHHTTRFVDSRRRGRRRKHRQSNQNELSHSGELT